MPVRRYVTLELLPDQIRWLQKQNAALTFGLVSTIVAGCLVGWPVLISGTTCCQSGNSLIADQPPHSPH